MTEREHDIEIFASDGTALFFIYRGGPHSGAVGFCIEGQADFHDRAAALKTLWDGRKTKTVSTKIRTKDERCPTCGWDSDEDTDKRRRESRVGEQETWRCLKCEFRYQFRKRRAIGDGRDLG